MYPYNVNRIDQQIAELNQLKTQMQQQPPIQNFINTMPQVDFEAKMLRDNEKVEEIIVQRKTAFIDLKNDKLLIKEINGDIAEYRIVKPKDAKDLEIERLQNIISNYERGMNNANQSNIKQSGYTTIEKTSQSNQSSYGNSRSEQSTNANF